MKKLDMPFKALKVEELNGFYSFVSIKQYKSYRIISIEIPFTKYTNISDLYKKVTSNKA